MDEIRLKPEIEDMISEGFKLTDEVWHIMGLVVAEWTSDPSSVACFDLRIVERAKEIVARKKIIDSKTRFL